MTVGAGDAGADTDLVLIAGSTSDAADSGSVYIKSGASPSTSGDFTFVTADGSATGISGALVLSTGTSGSGDSGSIYISSGAAKTGR